MREEEVGAEVINVVATKRVNKISREAKRIRKAVKVREEAKRRKRRERRMAT